MTLARRDGRSPLALVLVGLATLGLLVAVGCPERPDPFDCPDGSCVSDGDADLDSDSDSDLDSDADLDEDVEVPPGGCRQTSDCVLALNFNVCCPCIDGMARSAVDSGLCIVEVRDVTRPPERPGDCGVGCYPETCVPCPAVPDRVVCQDLACVEQYPGECQPGDSSCGEGRVCDLVEGEARCVEDPNECSTDEDCAAPGFECRDWMTDGLLWCWHPESICMDDLVCDYNHFCEDPDGDGIFTCENGFPDCRPWFSEMECPAGHRCADPDGDGRGTCVPA